MADSIGVYWGPRRESAEECARRLAEHVKGLSKLHHSLSRWYLKQRRRDAEKVPVAFDEGVAKLIELIASGSNHRDVGGDVMEGLGFQVGLWNGLRDEESVGLSIRCGLFDKNPNLGNAVVLTLSASEGSELIDMGLCKSLLLCGVEAWAADWGAVFDSGSEVLSSRSGIGPFLDRALWVRGAEASLPEAFRRKPVLDGVLFER